jgi:putative thiamine transport system substrate-binding protein
VNRLLAEKSAGRSEGGAVDLVWINGENFAALKQAGMLRGPFVETLPAFSLLDTERNPALTTDFTLPTEGYEAPWGTAQLTFYYDSAMLSEPPRTLAALAAYVRAHPGRFTYPQPPDFLGTTFLKQVLVTQAPDKAVLAKPVDEENFAAASAPVFSYLDEIQKSLWRGGRAFPQNGAGLRTLFAEREIDIGFTFNPGDASAAIEKGEVPDTVRSFGLLGGMIGNAHFLAIPSNASAKEGAMVVVNFLLSPEAQARKADPRVWGDPTVLSPQKMSPEERGLFDALPRGKADILAEDAVPVLGEPHGSWMARLEAEWGRRYGEAP